MPILNHLDTPALFNAIYAYMQNFTFPDLIVSTIILTEQTDD